MRNLSGRLNSVERAVEARQRLSSGARCPAAEYIASLSDEQLTLRLQHAVLSYEAEHGHVEPAASPVSEALTAEERMGTVKGLLIDCGDWPPPGTQEEVLARIHAADNVRAPQKGVCTP